MQVCGIVVAGGSASELLWVARRDLLPRGRLFLTDAGIYGPGRFALERLPPDTPCRVLGLSRTAWIALSVAGLAVAVLLTARRRDRYAPCAVAVEASRVQAGLPTAASRGAAGRDQP